MMMMMTMVTMVLMMMMKTMMILDLAKSNSLPTRGAARAPLVDDETVEGKSVRRGGPDYLGGKVKGASELKTCHNLVQDITRC